MNICNMYIYGNTSLNSPYGGAYESLARPGRKQTTTTEDFDVHMSYL